jgi:predicted MarR family transcription regulator
MAATVADRSSLALQRCSEPVVTVARPMLVTIEVPDSFEGWPVRCFAGAGIPSVTLVRKFGRALI